MAVILTSDWPKVRQLACETVWINLHLDPKPPPITGNEAIDQHWRQLAEARGYRRRPLVTDTSQLKIIGTSRHRLQSQAVDAIHALQQAAAIAGHQISVSSGYRDHDYQANLFMGRLPKNPDDQDVCDRLRWSAIPGYSWHHTGYTIDFREGDKELEQFVHSSGYRWLSENNYHQARAYGFMPNYPLGCENQGPEPEPWEFIWVGNFERLWFQIQDSLSQAKQN